MEKKHSICASDIIGDRDLGDIGFSPLDDFGWSELEPGHIIAVTHGNSVTIGFVTSKTETITDEWTLMFSPEFSSRFTEDERVCGYVDVSVARLKALAWTDSPVPTVVTAETYNPFDGTFYCRPVDDPDKSLHISEDRIAFITADNTAVALEEREPDTMKVTDVNVKRFGDSEPGDRNILAVASVVLGGQLKLNNLRVVKGTSGPYVAYPNDPFYTGEDYRDIFFPITRELRERIEEAVLGQYRLAAEA